MAAKRQNPQKLYMEWQNLKFDPAKYDIEDFCNDVKNLANRLGYPDDAQVMAIKATLPPVLVTQVINVKTFKEIRDTLITLVENPVIKRVLLTEETGEKGLTPFSQMQWQPENDVGMCDSKTRQLREEGRRTPKSLGKIINKIDNLELKMCKMSISDEKGKEMELKLEKKQMCNLSQVALVNGPSSKAVKKTESAPVSLLKLRASPTPQIVNRLSELKKQKIRGPSKRLT